MIREWGERKSKSLYFYKQNVEKNLFVRKINCVSISNCQTALSCVQNDEFDLVRFLAIKNHASGSSSLKITFPRYEGDPFNPLTLDPMTCTNPELSRVIVNRFGPMQLTANTDPVSKQQTQQFHFILQ